MLILGRCHLEVVVADFVAAVPGDTGHLGTDECSRAAQLRRREGVWPDSRVPPCRLICSDGIFRHLQGPRHQRMLAVLDTKNRWSESASLGPLLRHSLRAA